MKTLHFSRLAALTAAAALPLALAVPASAATTTIAFDCQADAPIIGPQQVSLNQDADVTAPATVAPGAAFDVVIDPAPNEVPGEVAGNTVKNINTFALKFPIPANSTYVSADLAAWLRPRFHRTGDRRLRRRRDPELPRPDRRWRHLRAADHHRAPDRGRVRHHRDEAVRHQLQRPRPDLQGGGGHLHRRHHRAHRLLPQPQPGLHHDDHRLTPRERPPCGRRTIRRVASWGTNSQKSTSPG